MTWWRNAWRPGVPRIPAEDRELLKGGATTMNLSVFGLGYVGAVSLACLARDGHHVIGVDIDPTKLELIRQGRTPIIEEGMSALMAEVVQGGHVQVTDDVESAVRNSEISFVCVGTPSGSNGSQDLRALERLSRQLGTALKTASSYHVVVVRSTVIPGTVEERVAPILEEASGKKVGEQFGLCFQPEFLREGSSIHDYDNPPFTVVGGDSERSIAAVRAVFGHLSCQFKACSIRTAEMLKYACNAFHALKITFANEMGRICQGADVDSHAVLDLMCEDMQLNISRAYLRPGFAFGGSCLPKDLRALCHLANRLDVPIPMLSSVNRSNELHIDHGVNAVLQTGRRTVGMLGLSFKGGTDDLRESPLVVMAERFIGKGLTLTIYDPTVSVSRLVGANRRYVEDSIPHIGSLMRDDLSRLIEESEVLVIGLRNPTVLQALEEGCRPDHFVLDLVNIPNRGRVKGTFRGVCW
jgi:GDP-mannose 6-dehydrogenase